MSLQFRRGLDADRTSITPLPGEPLWITDTDELYVGDGSTAGGVLITGGGGGGAPTNATYITQTSNGTLTNEQALASLATGILKNTTTTGVLSIAVGADLPSHTHTLADITDDGTMAAQNANNVAITGGSLTDVTVATGTYSSRVNETIMHAVRKASAGTINKGEVVRITGSSGTHLQVELADASVEATSTGTIGIAATSITSTTTGYMMITGELTGLSNVPTASFTNGAALWLSETTGAFTTTRPTQPAHGVFLGWVVEANNGSAGRIYVKVINYSELNELHDVLISGVADNHFLVYDNATSLWKNESPSDARTSLGLGTAATSNTGDFAAASHTHAAGDIVSGTLAVARGGTNLGTTPTNGQLLIGNGTGYTLSTLTQGSNITITNTSGAITIASTAGSSFDPATRVEAYSDFLGASVVPWQTFTNGTGAAVNFTVTGLTDNPGVITLGVGTTSTGRAAAGSNLQDAVVLGDHAVTFSTAALLVTNLSSSTERYIDEYGFVDSLAGPTNGVFFRYSDDINSGKWQCVCVSAGSETTADSGETAGTSAYTRFDISVNAAGNEAIFKINGTTVATITTNIPTGTGNRVGILVSKRKTVGTTLRQSRCDYIYFRADVTR